jgi:hypothetical protein
LLNELTEPIYINKEPVMANVTYKKPSRPVIPTPETASEELHNSLVAQMTAHYTPILTANILMANRKGAYAMVINSTIDNTPLEQLIGTQNAKVATEQVLSAVTKQFSAISTK